MRKHTLIATLAGAGFLLGTTVPLFIAGAQTPSGVEQPAAGEKAFHKGQRGGHMKPHPAFHLFHRLESIDFSAGSVSKPAFWDGAVAWSKTEDAKKLHEYIRSTMPKPKMLPSQAPVKIEMPKPVDVLSSVDFMKAGISKPSFWDAMVAWLATDDAKTLFAERAGQKLEMRAEKLAERAATIDFEGAGVTKPSFWGDLVTWLRSDDAKKVAAHEMTRSAPKVADAQ